MDLKQQATLAIELAQVAGHANKKLCQHDCMLAVGIALREHDPAFSIVICDFASGTPMLTGPSLIAVALNNEPFNLEGDWGWDAIFARYEEQSNQNYPSKLSTNKSPTKNSENTKQFDVHGDDWYDLVGYDQALIDDIEKMGDWLFNAIQIQVNCERIEQSTPLVSTSRVSNRL